MNSHKPHRQSAILELVERDSITSQEQLRARLRDLGIDATQATLSRDIRELGLVKRTADGAYRSAGTAAAGSPDDVEAALARATAEYLRGEEAVGHLIVLRTGPGQAQTLAVAIDRAPLNDVVGTIGGDDTILVICRTPEGAGRVEDRFRRLRRSEMRTTE